MRLLFTDPTWMASVNVALARELGVEDSMILSVVESEIAARGTMREGHRSIARNTKQLAELFPWCTATRTKKILESLCNRGYLWVDEAGLFNEKSLWLAVNWEKVKELKSVVVMTDGEMIVARTVPVKAEAKASENGHGRLHNQLMAIVIIMSDLSQPLLPKDAGEAGSFIKWLIGKYPTEDFRRLKARCLGARVWWQETKRSRDGVSWSPPRPSTIRSNWEHYASWCIAYHDGNLPPIPEELLRRFE